MKGKMSDYRFVLMSVLSWLQTDNTFLDLHNHSYHNQPHSVIIYDKHCIVIRNNEMNVFCGLI